MTPSRQIRAVVFDMDGLIFDTEALYLEAIGSAAGDAGHRMPLPLLLSTIGLSIRDTRSLLVERYGDGFDFDAIWAAASKRFHALAETQLRLKAGVVELLDALDEAALPRAIATSSRKEDVDHHLALHGLHGRFHAIVAHGDYERGKPHPEPFLTAAARLRVEPTSCLALEDSYNGVRAALGAGMMTIMVPDLLPPTPEVENSCLLVAQNLLEVREFLRCSS